MNTSGLLYDDFLCLFFLHTHRKASPLSMELPEDCDQFRFLRAASLNHLKGVCWFDRDQRFGNDDLYSPHTGSKDSDTGSKDQGTCKRYAYVVK